jgi:hypothetical protein
VKGLLTIVDNIKLKSVQVEIYTANNKIEQALDLLWKGETDFSVCEQFCQASPDPCAAFEVLMQQITKRVPPGDRLTVLMDLVARNVSAINIKSAFEHLDPDQSLDSVATFLESSYRTLLVMRKDAELDAAFAESNVFESEYQKLRYQCQCVVLDGNSKCAKCGREVNSTCVQRAPNGELYHMQCAVDRRDGDE